MKKICHAMLWVLFAIYCMIMLYLLFWQRVERSSFLTDAELLRANLNLVPFKTIWEYITVMHQGISGYNDTLVRISIVNLLGNVLVFLPLGLFLPSLWPRMRSLGYFLISVTAAVFLIELVQLFTLLGSCDIDDLILNLLGAAIGYLIYGFVVQKKTAKKPEDSPSL